MNKLNELLYIMGQHQALDALVQGQWWENGKGCFYGCAMQTSEGAIKKACEEYGIPLWIGYWSEKVFEGLPKEQAIEWPVKLLEAMVNFNGDYENVRHSLAIKRLSYLSEHTGEVKVKAAIEGVIECHKSPDDADWPAAKSAADSAAKSAADSAADSAAWSAAAWSAAAWSAALSAALSAACAAYESAVEVAWKRESAWMLEILEG